jgi:predicted HicB family RNase H-like nuclease
MSAPSKRRGRPRLEPAEASASVNLHIRISAKQFDRLYGEASNQKVSLADLVRAAITAKLQQP